jgi:hypothetical protein
MTCSFIYFLTAPVQPPGGFMNTPEQLAALSEHVAKAVISTMKIVFPILSPTIATGTSTPGVPVENYDNDNNNDNN